MKLPLNFFVGLIFTGGDLGEDWGTVPQKFVVGDGQCIGPPPIFREVVLSDARESTKRVKK